MGSYLIKGILIGLLFGMPVGAVGAMTVQRSIAHGAKAGLLTGLGSSAADCLYACVGAFGLTLISDFMLKYQVVINVIGGVLILIMVGGLLFRKTKTVGDIPQKQTAYGIKMFLSSFAVGITN
ncbi:MAG: LysE family transporter, partial [Oscillospiraceae bacterium]|nr:LysE family transporter [Oscillospiraceae bacterium]